MSRSLSAYARQFLEMMQKPDVDQIDGLSPAISIEQKTTSQNPRSTVGTVTEIYDYMRLLWARVGMPYSPATGLPIESQTVSQMVDRVLALPEGTRLYLLAPVVRGRKGEYKKELADWLKRGFQRRQDRRQYLRDRRRARARQEVQARYRRGGRPHRGPRRTSSSGWPKASRPRWAWPKAWRSRNSPTAPQSKASASRAARRRAHAVLGEIRLPGLRLHHRRDRAAPVLVQQPVRRLPGLRRARHRAAYRCRTGRPRQGHDAAQGRDRAVGEIVVALLHADAGGARQALQVHARHQVEGAAEEDPGRDPVRLGRRRDQVHL